MWKGREERRERGRGGERVRREGEGGGLPRAKKKKKWLLKGILRLSLRQQVAAVGHYAPTNTEVKKGWWSTHLISRFTRTQRRINLLRRLGVGITNPGSLKHLLLEPYHGS